MSDTDNRNNLYFRKLTISITLFLILVAILLLLQNNDSRILVSVISNSNIENSFFTKDDFGKTLCFAPAGVCTSADCFKKVMSSGLEVEIDEKNYVDDSNMWNVGVLSKDNKKLTVESYSGKTIKWISEIDYKYDDSLFKLTCVASFQIIRTPSLQITDWTVDSGVELD